MNKQELLQELQGLGKGLGAYGSKMSKSMGAPGLKVSPTNSAKTPPSQSSAGKAIAAADDQAPVEVAGPEVVSSLPKPEPLKLDKMGMPDKDKLVGHKVKYDGRDYILDWDADYQVYKLIAPDTKIVKTRVKPSQISVIDFVMKESLDTAVKHLISGAGLHDTVGNLLDESKLFNPENWKKSFEFIKKHKKKIIGGTVIAGLGGAAAYKAMKSRQGEGKATPAEIRIIGVFEGIANNIVESITLANMQHMAEDRAFNMAQKRLSAFLKNTGPIGYGVDWLFKKAWGHIKESRKAKEAVEAEANVVNKSQGKMTKETADLAKELKQDLKDDLKDLPKVKPQITLGAMDIANAMLRNEIRTIERRDRLVGQWFLHGIQMNLSYPGIATVVLVLYGEQFTAGDIAAIFLLGLDLTFEEYEDIRITYNTGGLAGYEGPYSTGGLGSYEGPI
jgi:hypothetical protein